MTSPHEAILLGWGKLRRFVAVNFRRRRMKEDLARRRGACNRCGACCKLLFRCPAYDDSDGDPKCTLYNDRPGVCALFPITEKDLRDRDVVMPGKACGFYFVRDEKGRFRPVVEEPKKPADEDWGFWHRLGVRLWWRLTRRGGRPAPLAPPRRA